MSQKSYIKHKRNHVAGKDIKCFNFILLALVLFKMFDMCNLIVLLVTMTKTQNDGIDSQIKYTTEFIAYLNLLEECLQRKCLVMWGGNQPSSLVVKVLGSSQEETQEKVTSSRGMVPLQSLPIRGGGLGEASPFFTEWG